MTLELRIETAQEFEPGKTADLARRSFGKNSPELSAARFDWTCRYGYEKVITVSAFLDEAKIGQVSAIIKPMVVDGQIRKTAELVDLFVAPESRNLNAGTLLYKELRAAVSAEQIDLVYAYANDNAKVLNKRFFHLKETTILPIHIGVSLSALIPFIPSRAVIAQEASAIAELCNSEASLGGGIVWSPEHLEKRLRSPIHSYVCASHNGLTILASPRVIRSVPVLLLCATFARSESHYDAGDAHSLIAALCRATGRALYLYAGWNNTIDLTPRLRIPPYRYEQKFTIQSNFLQSQTEKISRFELLDIDYG